MKIARLAPRAALVLIACAAAAAHAQDRPADYPKRPIRVVVGIAPGGGLDSMSRLGAQKLTERWGQTVIVDNRPGGGTLIGMDIVARAAPDGYTLLGASDTLMLNGVLGRAAYDVRKAFIPVVQLTAQPYVLIVTAALPVRSVKELIAYAKAKPGALSYGSQGLGTVGHIGWERFKLMAGVDILHVPYKGAAPAVIDTISGQGMNSPDTLKVLAADGSEVAAPATPEEFKAKFDKNYAGLESLIKTSNIKFN